jgi:membrane-associated phospholipid phosphatase
VTFVVSLRNRLGQIGSRLFAAGDLPGAYRVRRGLALLFAAYGVTLNAEAVSHGDLPKAGYVLMILGAVALYSNRGGRFMRDWVPALLGLYAYALAGSYADKLKLGVHYLPQADIDKILFGGNIPAVWLQQHVYHGTTGPLEVFSTFAYASHFFVPVFFAFYLWWTNRRNAFTALMFGLLVVLAMGEITFVLAPTAPPWMAADHGIIPPVHDLLKRTFFDMGLSKPAAFLGNPKNYNTVAAMPSLHAAWPVVGFLVARRFGLPRWTRILLLIQWFAVVFAIVYTGQHYVSDAILGALYAIVASVLVNKALGRSRAGKRDIPVTAQAGEVPLVHRPALERATTPELEAESI